MSNDVPYSWSVSDAPRITREVLVKSALTLAIVLIICFFAGFAQERAKSSASASPNNQSAILVGAGAIADCKDPSGAEATAKLLDQVPGTVMAVGDLAYPDGSKENFFCYARTWSRPKSRPPP